LERFAKFVGQRNWVLTNASTPSDSTTQAQTCNTSIYEALHCLLTASFFLLTASPKCIMLEVPEAHSSLDALSFAYVVLVRVVGFAGRSLQLWSCFCGRFLAQL